MDGLEASLHFAGIVGIDPMPLTVAELWRMAEGRLASMRSHAVEQSMLVWSIGEINVERYLHYGEMSESPQGKPVELPPELEAKAQEEIARIRAEQGLDGPIVRGTHGQA